MYCIVQKVKCLEISYLVSKFNLLWLQAQVPFHNLDSLISLKKYNFHQNECWCENNKADHFIVVGIGVGKNFYFNVFLRNTYNMLNYAHRCLAFTYKIIKLYFFEFVFDNLL